MHATEAAENFGTFLGGKQEDPGLSIVSYDDVIGFNDEKLGSGVRTDVDRKKGDMIPLVFGAFITEEKYIEEAKIEGRDLEFPQFPGVFALSKPYEKLVCVMPVSCPSAYVNDAKGVDGAQPNIHFLQHDNPRELYHDPMLGLHLLLQAQALCDIPAGAQLLMNYGDPFWFGGKPIDQHWLQY